MKFVNRVNIKSKKNLYYITITAIIMISHKLCFFCQNFCFHFSVMACTTCVGARTLDTEMFASKRSTRANRQFAKFYKWDQLFWKMAPWALYIPLIWLHFTIFIYHKNFKYYLQLCKMSFKALVIIYKKCIRNFIFLFKMYTGT